MSLMLLQDKQSILRQEDSEVMQFYAPIYLLLTICDREPAREEDAKAYLERHIRQFQRFYQSAKDEIR